MACHLVAETRAWLQQLPLDLDWTRAWAAAGSAYTLVAVAEFGDKSQLACMTLATRHRHWPVLGGALLAFALLNGLAVAFGAAAGHWLPAPVVALAVALLFAGFGLRDLLASAEEDDETPRASRAHGALLTTFLMIFLAEFGDKTQFAVAGLGATEPPVPVWLGATAALATTSALGIWAGKTLLRRLPTRILHLAGGLLFLIFAAIAAYQAAPLLDDIRQWSARHGFLSLDESG